MIRRYIVASLFLLCTPIFANAADELLDAGRASAIDFLLENAIKKGLIFGGVVIVGNRSGVVYSSSRGKLSAGDDSALLSERTRFDVASLTKVVATTPAVMKLLEAGLINLMDPLTKWFPELSGSDGEEITVLNLLTHTSGLDDVEIPDESPLAATLAKAAVQNSAVVSGSRFRYADINFILLGELVKRASGVALDRFCRDTIYAPSAMADTGFIPLDDMSPDIAPTVGKGGILQAGLVQDMNSRRFGGIAGHAGLFSSAADISRFATMILNKGVYNGRELFSERTINQMTAPYFYANGRIIRGLGWDINSPYSAPRGSYFSPMSFGHTGYSGSSLWIDPDQNLYVILLTIRLNYNDVRHFNQLRSDLSTLAVSIFSRQRPTGDMLEDLQRP
ncbi:MAG: serine hydrolase domain-containing protein [Desulfuromonadales bacterium]